MYKVFGESVFFFLNKSEKSSLVFHFPAQKITFLNTPIQINTHYRLRNRWIKKYQRGKKFGTRHIFIVYL